ncbi:MAG: polyhydroxyalkanoate synthesis repressor PhaR [Acetobacteraceae bacterium]|nr:polyhydroxyalkanoate synthesis repressor PhaR [Acetobacteraceae bacterium]
MSEPVRTPPEDAPAAAAPVVVKKYANRRLYNTESSSYITLDNLAEMIRHGRDFVVYDAKSGEDITRSVLTQIIVEEEGKGTAMLPTSFLRQLIGFYGDNLQALVPRYLEQAMGAFALQQKQMREAMQQTVGRMFPFTGMEEVSRQNMAMIERAMGMWSQLYRPQTADSREPDPQLQELAALRAEIESLRAQLAKTEAPPEPAQPGGAEEQSAKTSPPTEVNTKT